MAEDYRAIADTETDPLAPLVAALFKALEMNPRAIAAGSPDAPRIFGKACIPPSQLSEAPVLTVTAADTYTLVADAGVGIVAGDSVTTSASYVAARTITIQPCITGTVRFKGSHSATAGLSEIRITKNGTTVNSWSTPSTSLVARSEDIAVVPGDVVAWEHRNSGGSNFSTASETASAAYTRLAPLILQSDL